MGMLPLVLVTGTAGKRTTHDQDPRCGSIARLSCWGSETLAVDRLSTYSIQSGTYRT